MLGDTKLCDALARLLGYPDTGYVRAVEKDLALIGARSPETAERLAPFRALVTGRPVEELQEFYTRTFDVNPQCCLEIGWQIYGENYNRGAFLVWMRETLRELGLEESTELPDHLCHVLQVMGRAERPAAEALAAQMVAPALRKMAVGLAANENPYESVLEAILQLVEPATAEPEVVGS